MGGLIIMLDENGKQYIPVPRRDKDTKYKRAKYLAIRWYYQVPNLIKSGKIYGKTFLMFMKSF